MPQMIPTRVLREEWEVLPRLEYLQLERAKLLVARNIAVGAAADATLFFPANAAGTFSYHYGTFSLRNEFVGADWVLDRTNGVETIRNEARRIKIVFANVDIACSDHHDPKPRSSKGAGAERLCAGNDLFGGLPSYAPVHQADEKGWTVYYLMVAPDGAAELSCPVVKGGRFTHFVERLFLSDGSDLDAEPKLSFDSDDVADDFDPKVARKK
ncbi:hypothetical protein [Mesorhizobium sp. M0601]|uniref:hypothetical protein n=2 Tax=Mesorhizobium TaxID=68287 RepID=UPI00333B9D39